MVSIYIFLLFKCLEASFNSQTTPKLYDEMMISAAQQKLHHLLILQFNLLAPAISEHQISAAPPSVSAH